MRIVRAWSAMARVIACRIHHVAYVRELEALLEVELLDRADEADVALLDQVQERHAAADVLLRDRHDEPQVGRRQLLARVAPDADQLALAVRELGVQRDLGVVAHALEQLGLAAAHDQRSSAGNATPSRVQS